MKYMKHLAFAAIPALLAGLAGCQEEEVHPQKPVIDQNSIVFEAKASELTSEGVTITVSHNGTDDETYYGFLYTDIETTMANAINRTIAAFTENGTDISTVVTTGTTHISVLNDLEPLTTYRYVVFGLNTDGTIYGTPASVDFTTLKGDVTFSVSVSNITENTANASVKSSGDNTDTWYCFATSDMTSDLAAIVADEVARLGSNVSSVIKSGNTMVQLTGLSAGTSYRAVVTGLRSDGTTYGTPASAEFRTSFGQVDYVENDNWTVAYVGKGTSEGSPVDIISVTVSSGNDTYMPAVIAVDQFESVGIQAFTEGIISEYQSLLDYYNAMGLTVSWADILMSTTSDDLAFDVLDSNIQWYALAVGVDLDGRPTGLYAISDPFTPEELEASDAYNRWIGNWRIEDASGVGYDISLSALSPDISYSMDGWEADVFGGRGPAVTVNFDAASGNLVFISNENLGQVGLQNGETVDLGFYGNGDDGYFYTDSYDIAEATLSSDGNSADVQGNTLTSSSLSVTMVSMQFFGLGTSGNYSFSEAPVFPLTMTKSASGASVKTVRNVFPYANSAADGMMLKAPLRPVEAR